MVGSKDHELDEEEEYVKGVLDEIIEGRFVVVVSFVVVVCFVVVDDAVDDVIDDVIGVVVDDVVDVDNVVVIMVVVFGSS